MSATAARALIFDDGFFGSAYWLMMIGPVDWKTLPCTFEAD
jgi:hypothetical protein